MMSDDVDRAATATEASIGVDAATPVETLSFEAAYKELEATVQHLEEGDLTLEEAIVLYERGMHLARHCSGVLERAQLHVQQLTTAGMDPHPGSVPS